jgi:hypothetical protein
VSVRSTLSSLSSLLPRRRDLAVRSAGDVRRFSLTDYLGMVAMQWQYGGNLYPTSAYGVTTTQNGQQAEPVNSSFVGYCEGLLFADGPVAAVEAMRLRVFSQAPLLFQEMTKGRPGDLYDDESLDLVRAPWVGGTTSDLQKRSLLFADMGGNAYIVEVDDELVVLRPDWVQIVLEPRMHNGYQVGWRQVGITYTEGGVGAARPAAFLRGEYCHFAPLPDPLATYRGMSWLTPVIREVMTDKAATEHRLAFMGNAATPNLAVKIPQIMEKEQFEEFVDTMDSQHRGPQSAGKTLYYAGGADVTVVGATMQQMEFTGLLGKSETRVANAGGIHPVIVGFSEGMQGSSLNAGNYAAAKRSTVDTTFRDLWQNWCGSLQVLFPPPKRGHRLWYDHLDISFLSEDAKDLAGIQQTQAATIASLVVQGFKPESCVAAVRADDLTLLEHTGLTSVQLLPPGQEQGADGSAPPDQAAVDAAARALVRAIDAEAADDELTRAVVWALEEVERGYNPKELRNPKGSVGGGRFRSLADRVVDALKAHEKSGEKGDPFEGLDREELRRVAKARGITLPRGASRDFIGERILEQHLAAKAVHHDHRDGAAPAKQTDSLAEYRTMSSADARDALDLKKVDDLKPLLRDAGLPTSGRKRDLVDRLVEHVASGSPATSKAPAAAEPSSMPGGDYTGPRFTMPADVDKQALADLRARLHIERPETWSQGQASSRLNYPDAELEELINRLGPTVATRVAWEADNEAALGRLIQLNRPPDPTASPLDDLPPITKAELERTQAAAADQLRKDFAGKKVAVRVTPSSLNQILDDGRFKTQFETKRSGGGYLPTKRAATEAMMFGLPDNADPKLRPIYGYLAVEGVAPVRRDGDLLNTYGDVQVILKDSVRTRTTASVGDTLDRQVLPSPVDDPSWESFNGIAHAASSDRSLKMDYARQRAILYVEAHVHGGVGVDDVEEVVFATQPSAATKKRLIDKGVSWRVLEPAA